MATKGKLVRALRQRESDMQLTRKGSRNWSMLAIGTGVIDPIFSLPSIVIKTVNDFKTVLAFDRWKEKVRPKLLRNPKAAMFLAQHAKDRELKTFYTKIAREAANRAAVKRRIGAPKNPRDEQLNTQLRIKRRLRESAGARP